MQIVPCIFHACPYNMYILAARCMKHIKDAVWSLVLLLIMLIQSTRTHTLYDIICMYVMIVTYDFSLKYFIFLVCTW